MTRRKHGARCWTIGVLLLLSTMLCGAARAGEPIYELDIPSMNAAQALNRFAEQTGAIMLFSYDLANARRTSAVRGRYTLLEGLELLLRGTGLSGGLSDKRVVNISQSGNVQRPGEEPPVPNEKTSLRKRFTAFFTSMMAASAAAGQEANTDTQALEEIIVTATKREEKLQDVPFGISALSTADLERMGARGAAEYLAEMPGVQLNSLGRGRSPIVIRGVAGDASNLSNLQRSVELYIDELPILDRFAAWVDTDIDTFDIERVELLRGPQGTLFGSGALGGSVRLITNKPDTTQFGAKVEMGYAATRGGDDSSDVSGMLNIPLIEDRLALRVVGYDREDGGYVENVRRSEGNVDGGSARGGRAMLRFTSPNGVDLRLTALYDQSRLDDSPRTFPIEADGPSDAWDGLLAERSDAKLSILNLTGEFDLGPVSLTSTTTYGERDLFFVTDVISGILGRPTSELDPQENAAFIDSRTRRFAQEVRLSSQTDAPLEYTAGAFFMSYDNNFYQIIDLEGLPPPVFIDDRYLIETEEVAVFGEATYHVTPKVDLTAGARWFRNTYQQEIIGAGQFDNTFPLTKVHSTAISPRFSISYFPTEDVHLYASAARGYRVGQVNNSAAQSPLIPTAFDPDSLWNYEIGIKSTWLDNRLTTTAAVYYIDWSGMQLTRFLLLPNGVNANFTDNAGRAEVRGAEAEFTFRPVRSLEFGSSASWLDGELKSVLSGVPLTPGSRLPGSPKFSIANYIEYSADLSAQVSGYLRLGHRYVSEVVGNINNSPAVTSDPYNEFGIRAGFNVGRYEAAFYVDNLADEDKAVVRQQVVTDTPYAYRQRPRTFGVTLRASF